MMERGNVHLVISDLYRNLEHGSAHPAKQVLSLHRWDFAYHAGRGRTRTLDRGNVHLVLSDHHRQKGHRRAHPAKQVDTPFLIYHGAYNACRGRTQTLDRGNVHLVLLDQIRYFVHRITYPAEFLITTPMIVAKRFFNTSQECTRILLDGLSVYLDLSDHHCQLGHRPVHSNAFLSPSIFSNLFCPMNCSLTLFHVECTKLDP